MCQNTHPETCSRWYSYWCMGFGAVMFVLNVIAGVILLRGSEVECLGEPAYMIAIIAIGLVVSFLSILAGLLLMLGMTWDLKIVYCIGKILSYIAPIIYFILIFPVVILVLGVLKASEYIRWRWP